MTLLPIVARELRVTARHPATHGLRFIAATVMLMLSAMLIGSAPGGQPPAQLSQLLFLFLGIGGLGFCLLAGMFLTADCLSAEKRDGTLGLLFLTELKGYDVVLGKLAATSVHAIYGLLAVFPVFALPLLGGGVGVGEFGRLVLVLVAALLFSLSAGLLVSALSSQTRQAMMGTLLLLAMVAGVLPALWWLQRMLLGRVLLDDPLLWPSPGYAFIKLFDSSYRLPSGPAQFWGSFGTVCALGMTFLVAAGAALRYGGREIAPGRNLRSARQRDASIQALDEWRAKGARVRRLAQNPFLWLVLRDRGPRVIAWALLGTALFVWVLFLLCLRNPRWKDAALLTSFIVAYGLHFALKCLVALEASRRFSEDQQSGALEVLLVTPLSPKKIVEGQRQGLKSLFRGLEIALCAMNALMLWVVLIPNPLRLPPEPKLVFSMILLGGALMLPLDCQALRWVGMYLGLSGRRHHRAAFGALGRVMLAPWGAILVFFFVAFSGGLRDKETLCVTLAGWFLLGIGIDLWISAQAKTALMREFRAIARDARFRGEGVSCPPSAGFAPATPGLGYP